VALLDFFTEIDLPFAWSISPTPPATGKAVRCLFKARSSSVVQHALQKNAEERLPADGHLPCYLLAAASPAQRWQESAPPDFSDSKDSICA